MHLSINFQALKTPEGKAGGKSQVNYFLYMGFDSLTHTETKEGQIYLIFPEKSVGGGRTAKRHRQRKRERERESN